MSLQAYSGEASSLYRVILNKGGHGPLCSAQIRRHIVLRIPLNNLTVGLHFHLPRQETTVLFSNNFAVDCSSTNFEYSSFLRQRLASTYTSHLVGTMVWIFFFEIILFENKFTNMNNRFFLENWVTVTI